MSGRSGLSAGGGGSSAVKVVFAGRVVWWRLNDELSGQFHGMYSRCLVGLNDSRSTPHHAAE